MNYYKKATSDFYVSFENRLFYYDNMIKKHSVDEQAAM